jgi:hypothetical protein
MIRVTSKYSCTHLLACSWGNGVTSVTLYWCMSRVLRVRVRKRYSAATGIVHMVLSIRNNVVLPNMTLNLYECFLEMPVTGLLYLFHYNICVCN